MPAVTGDGSVPSATVNVSSSSSGSWFVAIVPVPLVAPDAIVMFASVPRSPVSAEPSVKRSGTVTLLDSDRDSRAVTVTEEPSATGFGAAESETVGGPGSVRYPFQVHGPAPAPFTARTRTV